MLEALELVSTRIGSPQRSACDHVVTEAELDPLPPIAQRYLRWMGVVGRPRDAWFRLAWKGRFRPRLDRGWSRCVAHQANLDEPITRRFEMRLHWGVLPLIGQDTYAHGGGRLTIRLFGALTLVNASGPELDAGELVTWLDDAILFAPSMLIRPHVTWSAIDGESFEVALTDRGLTVRARVFVDERGAPRDFATEDRWYEDPSDHRLRRARWTTPADGWETIEGRPTPTRGLAIWHLAGGAFPYVELAVVPGSLVRRAGSLRHEKGEAP
jgi:hypothetical protein